ncbi:DUF3168 domain-containing protein [Pseudooceanicola aestuarii]|uniref:DUF3168 domain-containing protein n=1 Tax=Pseudooceanicola aestuarii TaxID=2697319 RepID=UPI0013D230AA|nr:DUF3168 domain-containing protein [Pseudooceanicola aestuarii]
MSYALASGLQEAVFTRLSGDAAVAALTEGKIFDAPPTGHPPPTYVALGPERVRDRSDKGGAGAVHDFTVSVVTTAAGFRAAKEIAGALCDALSGPVPEMSRGYVVALNFRRARARRDEAGQLRRIDLEFRAFVQDD